MRESSRTVFNTGLTGADSSPGPFSSLSERDAFYTLLSRPFFSTFSFFSPSSSVVVGRPQNDTLDNRTAAVHRAIILVAHE